MHNCEGYGSKLESLVLARPGFEDEDAEVARVRAAWLITRAEPPRLVNKHMNYDPQDPNRDWVPQSLPRRATAAWRLFGCI